MNTPAAISQLKPSASHLPMSACLASGAVQAQSGLTGETLECTSGHLWVTVENEGVDHILLPGERYTIPSEGKVVIGGPGCYQLSQDSPSLRLAS